MNYCCMIKCKNKNNLIIKNKYYCKNHGLLFFNKSIIKIQKIYRAFMIRKKLKKIFYNLPKEIQHKILFFINKNFYIKKYNNVIRKIINKKTYNIILHFKLKNKLSIDFIKSVYYLNNKYRNILFYNDIKCLYVYGEEIIYILNKYIINNINNIMHEDHFLLQSDNFNIDIDLNVLTTNIELVFDTINIIEKFRLNYNNEVNIIKNNYITY